MREAAGISDRIIPLGPDLPAIPERLLLAHARGEALFVAGAGISQPAGLPDFRDLVLGIPPTGHRSSSPGIPRDLELLRAMLNAIQRFHWQCAT